MNEQPIPCQHHRTSGYVLRGIVVDAVNKTLSIELSDQRKELADAFYREMYDNKSELALEHENSCAWVHNPEEHCDCTLMDCFNWIKKWCEK